MAQYHCLECDTKFVSTIQVFQPNPYTRRLDLVSLTPSQLQLLHTHYNHNLQRQRLFIGDGDDDKYAHAYEVFQGRVDGGIHATLATSLFTKIDPGLQDRFINWLHGSTDEFNNLGLWQKLVSIQVDGKHVFMNTICNKDTIHPERMKIDGKEDGNENENETKKRTRGDDSDATQRRLKTACIREEEERLAHPVCIFTLECIDPSQDPVYLTIYPNGQLQVYIAKSLTEWFQTKNTDPETRIVTISHFFPLSLEEHAKILVENSQDLEHSIPGFQQLVYALTAFSKSSLHLSLLPPLDVMVVFAKTVYESGYTQERELMATTALLFDPMHRFIPRETLETILTQQDEQHNSLMMTLYQFAGNRFESVSKHATKALFDPRHQLVSQEILETILTQKNKHGDSLMMTLYQFAGRKFESVSTYATKVLFNLNRRLVSQQMLDTILTHQNNYGWSVMMLLYQFAGNKFESVSKHATKVLFNPDPETQLVSRETFETILIQQTEQRQSVMMFLYQFAARKFESVSRIVSNWIQSSRLSIYDQIRYGIPNGIQ